jgi:hypothetical protein
MTTQLFTASNRRTHNIIALAVFLAVIAFYLWEEHRAHLLGVLPYAIFLLCPLMHFFMHRGHGGHGCHGENRKGRSRKKRVL